MLEVFFAQIPQQGDIGTLFPKERHEQVQAVKNEKVKREKYYAWKLLELAILQVFEKPMQAFSFEKHSTGKWLCDAFEFSLSHSHGVVCVALSDAPVGVDIQKIQPLEENMAEKILSNDEFLRYQTCTEQEKTAFLISCFSKKESLFKQKNQKKCGLSAFKNLQGDAIETTLLIGGASFCLSVATTACKALRLHEKHL